MKDKDKRKVHLFIDVFAATWYGKRWGSTVWRQVFGNTNKLPEGSGHELITSDSGIVIDLYLKPMVKASRKLLYLLFVPSVLPRFSLAE